MQLTAAEIRVYGLVALLLCAFVLAAFLGYAYPALIWLGLLVPPAFLLLLVGALWRGRRGADALDVDQ
ncbi:MAG: hypothetical protein WBM50_06435, partial [Acidimicrobiales bacterium]